MDHLWKRGGGREDYEKKEERGSRGVFAGFSVEGTLISAFAVPYCGEPAGEGLDT